MQDRTYRHKKYNTPFRMLVAFEYHQGIRTEWLSEKHGVSVQSIQKWGRDYHDVWLKLSDEEVWSYINTMRDKA